MLKDQARNGSNRLVMGVGFFLGQRSVDFLGSPGPPALVKVRSAAQRAACSLHGSGRVGGHRLRQPAASQRVAPVRVAPRAARLEGWDPAPFTWADSDPDEGEWDGGGALAASSSWLACLRRARVREVQENLKGT